MHRYADCQSALSVALNLMIEEGDTLLVAAIAHPLHLVEAQIMQKRIAIAGHGQIKAPGQVAP